MGYHTSYSLEIRAQDDATREWLFADLRKTCDEAEYSLTEQGGKCQFAKARIEVADFDEGKLR